jgi:anti-sigma factor RsiW
MIDRVLHLGGFGCSDTEQLLFEYVEEELPADVRAKLEKHLDGCRACEEYVTTYRRTIEVTHKHGCPETEMPPELQRRLKDFLAQNPELR